MKFLAKLKSYLFFLALCFIFFIGLFFINNLFLIKKVELLSDKNFVLVNKDKLMNQSLIFIDEDKLAKKIVQENPFLKTVKVNKVWPDRLRVTASSYEPTASLAVNQGFFELSSDGRILTKTKKNNGLLPTINYYQKLNSGNFQVGDWIGFGDIKQALFFIDKLNQINLRPLTIDIAGQDMLVFKLDAGKKITFSVKKDREQQDYLLEMIIRQFKIQGKDFKGIDLRFDKPIIQF